MTSITRRNNVKFARTALAALGTQLIAVSACSAAAYTWAGNGDPNGSGTWETSANWNPNTGTPSTSADDATLGDVTSGTRIVTIGSAETIKSLSITQASSGFVNQLNVNANLTITGTANPFSISAGAGQSSIVTNIASGVTLSALNAAAISPTFNGALNLGSTSTFLASDSGASGAVTMKFGGPVTATGAGAMIVLQSASTSGAIPTFNGAVSTTGSGSSLTLQAFKSTSTGAAVTATFGGSDGSGNAISVGADTQMNLSYVNGSTFNFTNRVSVAAPSSTASVLNIGSDNGANNGTTTANFTGGLMLGASSKAALAGIAVAANFNGTSTLNAGSTLLMQYSNNAGVGSMTVANGGSVTADGAALQVDYNGTNSTSTGVRIVTNNGTLTLKNNASLLYTSSSGKQASGFGIGGTAATPDSNTGTMSVLSGSQFGFNYLTNTGTLTAGSTTSGASDATVLLGSPTNTFTGVTLNNGTAATSGALNVNGNVTLGRSTFASQSIPVTLNNGVASGAASSVVIGDGTTPTTFTLSENNAQISNLATGTMTIKPNAVIALTSTATNGTAGNVTLSNAGLLTTSGDIRFQGDGSGGLRTVTNAATGTLQISGQNAKLTALAGTGGTAAVNTNVPALAFTNAGAITGASASDTLTYVNGVTSSTKFNTLTLNSTGSIAPGNGSNGSGTSSIGALTLVNTKVVTGNGAAMTFDIGGSGNADSLTLASGLDLSAAGDTINFDLVNGFTPDANTSYSWQVINGPITGSFDTVNLPAGSGWSYNQSTGVLILSVPEPACLCMVGPSFVLLMGRRCKRRNAAC